MKFGGTSVGDVTRIKAVADTIRSELRPIEKLLLLYQQCLIKQIS